MSSTSPLRRLLRARGALLCALVLAGLAAGCGANEAEQACEDFADALATAAQNCGLDYQTNYDAVVALAAAGDCGNVKSVRDSASFYDGCLPFIEGLTCEQVNDAATVFPESCVAQLIR